MKTLLYLSLLVSASVSFASLSSYDANWADFTRWDFGSSGLTSVDGKHIGWSTNNTAYGQWENLASNGLTDNNSDGNATVATGSTRITGSSSQANYYLGSVNFGLGGSLNLANDPYIYEADKEVKLAVRVTDIDFDGSNGNSQNNTSFSVRLWDKLNESYIGISLMDNYASDKLSYSVISSEGTIISGGTGLTKRYNRTRADWIQNNTNLVDNVATEYALRINFEDGLWAADVDGIEVADGEFINELGVDGTPYHNTGANNFTGETMSGLTGMDRYQVAFQQIASDEDSIDLDYISIQTIPEPATVGLLTGMGGGLLWIRRRFRG